MSGPADLLIIDPRDNVATAVRALAAGATARVSAAPGGPAVRRGSLVLLEAIPPYHKAALRHIAAGEAVIKYGEPIGTALRDVRAGEHVHVHNLAGRRAEGSQAPEART